MGHNFSSDTTPKNEVVRSGLKFGWLESYLMVLPTKKIFSFWQIFTEIGGDFQTFDLQTNITYFFLHGAEFYIISFFSLFCDLPTVCNHFWNAWITISVRRIWNMFWKLNLLNLYLVIECVGKWCFCLSGWIIWMWVWMALPWYSSWQMCVWWYRSEYKEICSSF